MERPDVETRIVIRAQVTDIPGDPVTRPLTLGGLLLSHPIRFKITPGGFDHCVNPPDYYSDKPIHRWFIYDLNVTGRKTTEELLATPHKVFLASKQNDNWVFVPRDTWIAKAMIQCKTFRWGGTKEQEWLDNISEEATT